MTAGVRLATFNVQNGRSLRDGRVDPDRLAAAIEALDADVLALQEVDRDQPRSGGTDLAELAARAAGAAHRWFVPTLFGTPGGRWVAATDGERTGPAYGVALVSRFPLERLDVVHVPALPVVLPLWLPGAGPVLVREEPRVAAVARVHLPGGAMTIATTHLPFVPVWNVRALRRIVAALTGHPDPVVLLGDLNLRGSRPARVTGYTPLVSRATFPSPRPAAQLDHVLARGDVGTVVSDAAPDVGVSDHRPLVVQLRR